MIVPEMRGLEAYKKSWAGFPKKLMSQLGRADLLARKHIVETMRKMMAEGMWSPNEPDYQQWKSTHGYDTRPLFRTHLLANSISHERNSFSPELIRCSVGWHEGMRYFGSLREMIYRSRVPKNARKYKGPPTSARNSTYDTQYLAQVAYWLEHGSGSAKRSKGKGGAWKTKFSKEFRPARPFVRATHLAVAPTVVSFFSAALAKALPISGLEEAPF